tara:strand:+ start:25 stop:324 length:300 start_codon:yes stop_codon:yes gene_type:complete
MDSDLIVGERKIILQDIIANIFLSIFLNFKQRHLKKNIEINKETVEFKILVKSCVIKLLKIEIIIQKIGEFLVPKPVSPKPNPFHVSTKLVLNLLEIFK